MTISEIKQRKNDALDAFKSLQAMMKAGIEIGNTYGFVSKEQILKAHETYRFWATEYSCSAEFEVQ